MPLFHSAGAGLSLAAAGTTVLLGASAMVAFNGWPGMQETAAPAPVRLAAAPPPLRDAEGGVARPSAPIRLRAVPARRSMRARAVTRTSAVAPARGDVLGIHRDAPRASRPRIRPAAAPPPATANAPETRATRTPVQQVQQTVDEVVKPIETALDPVKTVVGGAGQAVDGVVTGLRGP